VIILHDSAPDKRTYSRARSRQVIDWRGSTPHPCNLGDTRGAERGPPIPHGATLAPADLTRSHCRQGVPVTETREDVTWLTQEAHDRLKAELDYLAGPARVEIAKKLEAARDEGDLRENGGRAVA